MQVCTRSFTVAYGGDTITIGQGERVADDHEVVTRYPTSFVEEVEYERTAAIFRSASKPGATEAGATFHTPRERTSNDPRTRAADDALRAIERHAGVLEPQAADRLDGAVRSDRLGLDSEYLAAVAEPAYSDAFGKLLQYGAMAPTRFTPQENEAVQRVTQAEQMRSMTVGTGSEGGFAVPFVLDPSIMNTSAGVNDPIRELSRVVTITGATEWRGVSAASVTSNYGQEASEVNDDSPTLAQPSITAERWTSFVPFSMEIGMDFSSLQTELAELMADSKRTLDATKMLTGTGADEPGGILNIGGTGGLTTTQRIQSVATAGFAVADVYALKQALPPRFQTNGTYVMSPTILDVVYRFVPAGSTTEPALLNGERTSLIGRPVRELSTMSTTTATASRVAIYADWKAAFTIVDRLGVQVELVNHLFGVNRRPDGRRGLLAIGRTGSGVTNANAARYLEVR